MIDALGRNSGRMRSREGWGEGKDTRNAGSGGEVMCVAEGKDDGCGY